jgi:hypothetical protein
MGELGHVNVGPGIYQVDYVVEFKCLCVARFMADAIRRINTNTGLHCPPLATLVYDYWNDSSWRIDTQVLVDEAPVCFSNDYMTYSYADHVCQSHERHTMLRITNKESRVSLTWSLVSNESRTIAALPSHFGVKLIAQS